MQKSGIAGSYGWHVFLWFWGFSILISILVLPVSNPENCEWGSFFPYAIISDCPVCCIIGPCHSGWVKMNPRTVLICISLIARNSELSLSNFFFLFRTLCSCAYPTFGISDLSFWLFGLSSSYILMGIIYHMCSWQIFFPIRWVSSLCRCLFS